MFGIEVNYKNGKKDWIDPVTEDPVEKDSLLIIQGQVYSYEYSLVLIDKWFKYGLCPVCQYDTRTYDCKDECFNPRY